MKSLLKVLVWTPVASVMTAITITFWTIVSKPRVFVRHGITLSVILWLLVILFILALFVSEGLYSRIK